MLLLAAGCPKQQYLDVESYDEGGFLKLSKTHEWLAGEDSAPLNKKATSKELQDDREREKREKLNFLQYEAVAEERISAAISWGWNWMRYCFLVLSVQASISYSIGLLFSAVACTFSFCASMWTIYLWNHFPGSSERRLKDWNKK
ncbi:hypothetical protein SAY86_032021 [Trapa natans]|uniref:Uncharacterized protein n=1 Tax=Trapa natans TaxID=22666 RepID=A0AAN7LMS3_TRANT|nr:hypothetical protein SAY86_032021 [Trapa natans]